MTLHAGTLPAQRAKFGQPPVAVPSCQRTQPWWGSRGSTHAMAPDSKQRRFQPLE